MSENLPTTVELKESQLKYLDQMVEKHSLSDRSKALRCLITFGIVETEQEDAIFSTIRCVDC